MNMNETSKKTRGVNGASGRIGRAVANRIVCASVAVAAQCLVNAAKVSTRLGAADVAKAPCSVLSYAFRSASKRLRANPSPSADSDVVEVQNHSADEIFRWEDDGGRVVE